jgi:hypothetical protein
VHDR